MPEGHRFFGAEIADKADLHEVLESVRQQLATGS